MTCTHCDGHGTIGKRERIGACQITTREGICPECAGCGTIRGHVGDGTRALSTAMETQLSPARSSLIALPDGTDVVVTLAGGIERHGKSRGLRRIPGRGVVAISVEDSRGRREWFPISSVRPAEQLSIAGIR